MTDEELRRRCEERFGARDFTGELLLEFVLYAASLVGVRGISAKLFPLSAQLELAVQSPGPAARVALERVLVLETPLWLSVWVFEAP